MIDGIILAAGESQRMGQLKPIISINGKTVLAHIEQALRQADISRIFVVVGFSANLIQKKAGVNAQFVLNEHYQHGQFSSLQRGIAELSQDSSGVVVCLGDQPQIDAEWIRPLVAALEKTSAKIIRPSFGGKSGHPVVYASDLYEEMLHMPPTATAKELMQTYKDSTEFVPLDSEGILYDADTPEDLLKIRKFIK